MISKELLIKSAQLYNINLDDTACVKFDLYAKLLVEYNEKVNLTRITEPDDIVIKHFVDSLALCKFVDIKDGIKLCDVGTGAGFPGMALLVAKPNINVTLFDSINKKLEFLRFLSKELDLSPEIVTVRAEDAGKDKKYREKFDIVTARAVAQLNVLSEYCIPLAKVGGVFAPLKAVMTAEEEKRGISAAAMLGAKKTDRQIYKIPDGSDREVIVFEKISPTPTKYPRVAAQISKKPL